jgi:NADH-quinone oxidoreductase subunit D
LADIPLLIAGMDPCFSCNDRMVTVRRGNHRNDPEVWSWEMLRNYGIEYYRKLAGN